MSSETPVIATSLAAIDDDATFLRHFARVARTDVESSIRFELIDRIERIASRLSASSAARSPDQPSGGTLSVREMQEINALRSARWMAGSPGWTTLEVAGELAGEVGELANVCKKLRRSEMGVPGNKVSDAELLQQARGEIADVMIVLMLTASKLGIDLQDAVCETFNAKSEQMGFPERLSEETRIPSRSEGEAERAPVYVRRQQPMSNPTVILGRFLVAIAPQAGAAPFIDRCTSTASDGRVFPGILVLLKPWKRNRYGESLPQRGLVFGWERRRRASRETP